MIDAEDSLVWVRRHWNDHRQASVRSSSLSGLRWDVASGGIAKRAPQPFLHAYISCDQILEGDLAHSCLHGPPPHSIKVCIVKKDNEPAVFDRLLQIAGPKPARQRPR